MRRLALDLALGSALVALIGWPALVTARDAATPSAGAPAGLDLARPLGLAAETLRLVIATEAIALPLGVLLAWLLFRADLVGRRIIRGLVALGLFVPLPLQALAWLGSFGNPGRAQALGAPPILAGRFGAAFVHAMSALPWVVLLVGVGLRSVEPELEESALLDLPAWRVALRVSLRRAVGPIAGAALAVAVLTATDMTVTDLIPLRTYAEEAYTLSQLGVGPGAVAAAVTLPSLLVLGPLVALAASALMRADPARLASASARAPTWPLGRRRLAASAAVWGTAGLAAALPLYGLAWRAGRVRGAHPGGPRWSLSGLLGTLRAAWPELVAPDLPRDAESLARFWDESPLVRTLAWSAVAAAVATTLAALLAWSARDSRWWRAVVAFSVALTLAAPGPVVGMALKRAYLLVPPVHDTPALLVMGYVVRTLPYALLVLWPAVRSFPPELLDAAAVDGLSPPAVARRVVVPLLRPALLASGVVCLALSLAELPVSYFTAPAGEAPMSLVLWNLLHTGVESHLAGVGLLLLAVVAALGTLAAWIIKGQYRII